MSTTSPITALTSLMPLLGPYSSCRASSRRKLTVASNNMLSLVAGIGDAHTVPPASCLCLSMPAPTFGRTDSAGCDHRHGGHGFNSLAPLNMASYAASIIDVESLRQANEPSVAASRALRLAEADACLREFFRRLHNSDSDYYRSPPLDMAAARLASKPDNIYNILHRAWGWSAASFFWEDPPLAPRSQPREAPDGCDSATDPPSRAR
eukprot:GFKZ01002465.1.p1 GENE.GFKZ01002465.1~~GFKZ01002465.1.p1  ORF type:complete len:208 (-),score=5.52 GFKZ01002465.1:72-695(-)